MKTRKTTNNSNKKNKTYKKLQKKKNTSRNSLRKLKESTGCLKKSADKYKKVYKRLTGKGLTIGMITVPITPTKKFFEVCGDSYIATSHIVWLKRYGINIVPIPWSTKKFDHYMKICNGFYFPSGGAFAGTQKEYYNCCKTFLNLAIKENDKGNYTPIWGCCMGMQQQMIIAEGSDDLEKLLQKFDSFNSLLSTLKFTEQGLNSRLMRNMTQNQIQHLSKNPCTLNNHKMGITPQKFKLKTKLNKFYKIVSTSFDRNGREYVSTIEAYHYPFYGVQWHPERSSHMDYFVKFLIKELRKNPIKKKKTIKKMFSKNVDCFGYSNALYKKCNFYWHKRTSKHNKKLCNVAQIQKSRKESGERGV